MRDLCLRSCRTPDGMGWNGKTTEWDRSTSLHCGVKLGDIIIDCLNGNCIAKDCIYVFMKQYIHIYIYYTYVYIPIDRFGFGLVTCRWHQTSNCAWDGPREHHFDKGCDAIIASGMSGYCKCADNTIRMKKGCEPGNYQTCEAACTAGI